MTRKEPKLEYRRAQVVEEDFWKEIDARCCWAGIPNGTALGKVMTVAPQTVSNYRREPGKIQLKTMQKLVKVLKPDIGVILRYLGYSNQEIRKFAKGVME